MRLLDLAAPGAALRAAPLDQLLEALQVALDAAAVGADRRADGLDGPVRLPVHLHHHARRVLGDLVEADDAGVLPALGRLPGHAMVGVLLGDLRAPLLPLAADLRRPEEMRVVELLDALDSLHELRELLELRPLVVDRGDRCLDLDRLLDACHALILSSGFCPMLRTRAGAAGNRPSEGGC